MDSESTVLAKMISDNVIDPTGFDVTVSALLVGLGAEEYLPIFRKHNIGQCTLMELNDEDLMKLGVDNKIIRDKLLSEVKNLPIYQETVLQTSNNSLLLGPLEIIDILEESSQHLYRIYLSMMANSIALKKSKKVTDCLLHQDKYASDVCLTTLSHMTNILNSMDIALHTKFKVLTSTSNSNRKKKIVVGTVGSAVIIVLSVLFVRSLKQI
ncbi:uncharacterized protein LOC119834993 [Zerene cesonia]|uniref:uncharacterized protein LOC119834993 n=1 Tax=Zerene cesonia TaxID=33412 RepID=UPI0018E529AE|nr:uncharacterized protein LOC119834993 [Zerene cesonia]